MVFLVALAVAPGLWAAQPQAVLESLKGKVEVKAPGSSVWVKATEGQVLSPEATLSTGFDSSAAVVIGKTTIQVKPLTRLTIDKLVEEAGTVKTSSFLRVGSVSASVKSAEGVKQEFKVQSPYSTASVRGTEFDFDGVKLKVREGLVALILGRPVRETQPKAGEDKPAEATEQAAPGAPGAAGADPREQDFVGAPDVAADEDHPVLVPVGKDAQIVVDYTGAKPQAQGSTDRSTLEGNSGVVTDTVTSKKTSTKGTVSVTVKFAD